jgi:hypothetical protein
MERIGVTARNSLPVRFERTAPDPGLYSRLRRRIGATPAPGVATSSRVIAALLLLPALTAIAVTAASQIVYGRPLLAGLTFEIHSAGAVLLALLSFAALTIGTTFVTIRRGDGWGAGPQQLLTTAALATPAYALLALLGRVHSTDLIGPSGVMLSAWAYRCLILASFVGVLVLTILAMALRRAVTAGVRLRGAAVGATAGLWSGLAVFIFCPSGNGTHLLIGHVLPVLGFTLLGAAIVPRVLRP